MSQAYKGERLHIAILGRCNTGKSTVLNLIAGQRAAIVSPRPGTTGDPLGLPFELPPLGPVTLYDTAGLDETSDLGDLRREAGRKVLAGADLAVLVTDEAGIGKWEKDIVSSLRSLGTPFILLFNKDDLRPASETDQNWCREGSIPFLSLNAAKEQDPTRLREAIVLLAPEAPERRPLIRDILAPGSAVILVTPIDASAPKGRLIAPQVQVLRELVDANMPALVLQPPALAHALTLLREAPALVITDSQVVREVAALVPEEIPLTTFSIILARYKADFALLLEGARAIDSLQDGARVLVAEACSHHAQDDDIARIKLPRLLKGHTGRELTVEVYSGKDFPDDLERFDLVIHCGGCMLNPGEMRRRLRICAAAGVKATNFGMAISLCQGVLERACRPFIQ
ncbi:[FeFe] hydrogenase H-cluster maturation GTPase HydF [Desulfovibrio sp. OttesenSCG-928-M16]|nr:[FeFe] hydrogenase H-cluster maturation GTPase HydF [Desulfovibrio sp. OttesenSCG-928-M16]